MIGVMARPAEEAPPARPHPSDFDAWMRAEQRRIFQLCYRLLGERDEADTATQDVFLKAFRALSDSKREELEEPAAWLTRVTVNACLDRLRSRRWRFWQQSRGAGEEVILRMARPQRQKLRGLPPGWLRVSASRRAACRFCPFGTTRISLKNRARPNGWDCKAHLARAWRSRDEL
jgi:hypothetical protein